MNAASIQYLIFPVSIIHGKTDFTLSFWMAPSDVSFVRTSFSMANSAYDNQLSVYMGETVFRKTTGEGTTANNRVLHSDIDTVN